MISELSRLCFPIVLMVSMNIFLYPFASKADTTSTVTVQTEDPSVSNEIRELEVLKGKDRPKMSRDRVMLELCKNVNADGMIVRPKANATEICQKLYKSHIRYLRRSPFCKGGVGSLPPEINANEADQIAALLKKRCDAAIKDDSL